MDLLLPRMFQLSGTFQDVIPDPFASAGLTWILTHKIQLSPFQPGWRQSPALQIFQFNWGLLTIQSLRNCFQFWKSLAQTSLTWRSILKQQSSIMSHRRKFCWKLCKSLRISFLHASSKSRWSSIQFTFLVLKFKLWFSQYFDSFQLRCFWGGPKRPTLPTMTHNNPQWPTIH